MSKLTYEQHLLDKAMKKAVAGGWITMSDEWEFRGNGVYFKGDTTEIRLTYPDIIFDHSFAQALWGDAPKGHLGYEKVATLDFPGGGRKDIYNYHPWQEHLQQMVIAEDPIAYLGANT